MAASSLTPKYINMRTKGEHMLAIDLDDVFLPTPSSPKEYPYKGLMTNERQFVLKVSCKQKICSDYYQYMVLSLKKSSLINCDFRNSIGHS